MRLCKSSPAPPFVCVTSCSVAVNRTFLTLGRKVMVTNEMLVSSLKLRLTHTVNSVNGSYCDPLQMPGLPRWGHHPYRNTRYCKTTYAFDGEGPMTAL